MTMPADGSIENNGPVDSGSQVDNTPISTDNVSTDSAPVGGDSTPAEEKLSDAWNEVMGIIPSQLHKMVTPHFKNWDANFTRKTQEIHSQYAPYKSYLENNIGPDQINYALEAMQAIETDPMQVIQAITDYAKNNGLWVEPQQAQQLQPQDTPDETSSEQGSTSLEEQLLQHPKFLEMQQAVQMMAQHFMDQNQQAAVARQEQEYNSEIQSLTQKYGDFDQEYVLTQALAAMNAGQKVTSLEPFVQQYQQFTNDLISKSRQQAAPTILNGAGQADTSNQFNPKTATSADKRALVAKILSSAAKDV